MEMDINHWQDIHGLNPLMFQNLLIQMVMVSLIIYKDKIRKINPHYQLKKLNQFFHHQEKISDKDIDKEIKMLQHYKKREIINLV